MTTKPKTRKAPAPAKTVTPALEPYDYYEANREKFANDIGALVARWRFLEADRRYHEALGLGWERHKEEKDKIAQRLAQITPENLEDVRALIEFAMEELVFIHGPSSRPWRGMKILGNAKEGISKVSTKMMIDSIDRQLDAVEEAKREFARTGA